MSDHPPQVKWLGARVERVGTVVAVTQQEHWGVCLIHSGNYYQEAYYIDDLKRLVTRMPKTQQPYNEGFDTTFGGHLVEMYVLGCTPEEVVLKPPKFRRRALQWGVHR